MRKLFSIVAFVLLCMLFLDSGPPKDRGIESYAVASISGLASASVILPQEDKVATVAYSTRKPALLTRTNQYKTSEKLVGSGGGDIPFMSGIAFIMLMSLVFLVWYKVKGLGLSDEGKDSLVPT